MKDEHSQFLAFSGGLSAGGSAGDDDCFVFLWRTVQPREAVAQLARQ